MNSIINFFKYIFKYKYVFYIENTTDNGNKSYYLHYFQEKIDEFISLKEKQGFILIKYKILFDYIEKCKITMVKK